MNSWWRLRFEMSNGEATLVIVAFLFLLAGSVWFASQAALEHQRFTSLVRSVDAKCVQHQDGSGECKAGAFSGVGVTP